MNILTPSKENIGWIHFRGTGAVAYGVVWSRTLSVNTTGIGEGTGRVTSEPTGVLCGEDCDANGQVTMDANKTCTATFGYPVGGFVVPVDRLGLVAPWVAPAALAAVVGVLLRRARRRK